jgi:YVTN family beta-propeller protein
MISARVECRNYRNSATYSSAVWLRLCALALGLCVSIGWSQPAPDTILLMDSLGPLRPGYHLAFGSSTNNIYVASESSDIIVVDGETFQRTKRISTGTPVGGALLVSQHNSLYCSYPMQGRIGVIDCATNSIVGSIEVGTRPTTLCYSSGSDRIYCGDTIDCTISVIDCATNAVLKVIPVGESLSAMAYDPTTDKMHAATRDAVLAISCPADSVVATISAVKAARGLCVNKRRQKLYVVGRQYQYPDTVCAISTGADSLVAKIPWNCDPHLACNELTDRLYGMDDDARVYVRELDCTRDTLVRSRFVGGSISTAGLFCDTLRNRLYYLCKEDDRGYLLVLDCATLDVISETQVEDHPDVLEADPARNRVMCAGATWSWEGVLTVFDYKHDSLDAIGFVPLYGWQRELCHNPVAGKLYYRWGDGGGGVAVVDEQTNRVVAQILLPQKYGYAGAACCRTSNKMYFEVASGLAVVDGAGDSLLKLINLDGSGSIPFWYPDSNKLYCFVNAGPRWYIAVLDCCTDSVVREIEAYHGGVGTFMLLNESLLLGAREDGLTLIDCWKDSVLIDTTTPGNIYAVAHSGNDKVYIVHHYTYDRLEALGDSTLSLLATVDWHYSQHASEKFLVCSDSSHKLYWIAGDSILVIDTRSDSVVARLYAGSGPLAGCLDRSGRYIFCPSPSSSSVVVYDTRCDSLAAVYMTPPYPFLVVPNPELGRIYAGCADAILSYPDTLVVPGVCEEPASPLKRFPQTVLRATNVNVVGTAAWYDVTGRHVAARTTGAGHALGAGVYLSPGRGHTATKIIVVR